MVHRCSAGIARLGELAQPKKHNAHLLLGKGVGGRHTVALEEPFEYNHRSLQQLNCGGEGWSSLTVSASTRDALRDLLRVVCCVAFVGETVECRLFRREVLCGWQRISVALFHMPMGAISGYSAELLFGDSPSSTSSMSL